MILKRVILGIFGFPAICILWFAGWVLSDKETKYKIKQLLWREKSNRRMN